MSVGNTVTDYYYYLYEEERGSHKKYEEFFYEVPNDAISDLTLTTTIHAVHRRMTYACIIYM